MQHILSLVRRCVEDYNMIEAGDTVAVGVSGGKDSVLTLAALAKLRAFFPRRFEVAALTSDADGFRPHRQAVRGAGGSLSSDPGAHLRDCIRVPEGEEPLLPVREAAAGGAEYGDEPAGAEQDRPGAPLRRRGGDHGDESVSGGADRLLPAGDVSGQERGDADTASSVRSGAGGPGRGAPSGASRRQESVSRKRDHQAGGDEGAAPPVGEAVPAAEKEDFRGYTAVSAVWVESGGGTEVGGLCRAVRGGELFLFDTPGAPRPRTLRLLFV